MKIDRLQTRDSVLGPVLFLCHIDDLPCSVTSQVRLFADDCLLYRTIRTQADHISLQNDLTELEKWVMCFNVWDRSDVGLQDELENVQNRAARFVTGNYKYETESMTGILEHLKWETLKKRRGNSCCYTKVWRVKPVYKQMTLSPWLGVARIVILCHQVPGANTDI